MKNLKRFYGWTFLLATGILMMGGCSRSVDDLIGDLSSENAATRSSAAQHLLQRADNDITRKLVAQMNKNDDRLTFIVCQILGDRADTSAVPALGQAAKHSNPHIRERALWSIGSIGYAGGLPYLAEGIKDSEPMVRKSAVLGIGYIHNASGPRLLYPMLRDPVDSVRTAAIQSLYALRSVKGSDVLAADLAAVVNDPSPTVRYVAVQALGGGFSDTTVAGDLLLDALRDDNEAVRIEAIVSLQKIKFTDAVPVLKQLYDTASVDEESAISDAIKAISGETYPSGVGK